MNEHLDPELLAVALDQIPADRRRDADGHLAGCSVCRDRLDELLEALAREFCPPPDPLDPRGLERLLDTVTQTSRFEAFVPRVAAALDLSEPEARSWLARIDLPEHWTPGMHPAMHLMHPRLGPRLADAVAGFVRLRPGTGFAEHHHLGPEVTLVLQGGLQIVGDATYRRGDEILAEAGTSHAVVALPGPDLVFLSVNRRGLRIGDTELTPAAPGVL